MATFEQYLDDTLDAQIHAANERSRQRLLTEPHIVKVTTTLSCAASSSPSAITHGSAFGLKTRRGSRERPQLNSRR